MRMTAKHTSITLLSLMLLIGRQLNGAGKAAKTSTAEPASPEVSAAFNSVGLEVRKLSSTDPSKSPTPSTSSPSSAMSFP